MKGIRAAVRYAKALTQFAQEKGQLDTIILDIKLILSTINNNRELELMLQSPLIKTNKKKSVLTAIFGNVVSELSIKFIDLITAQSRERILSMICEEFISQYNELKNIARVSVTTSTPLSSDLKKELLKSLKNKYQFSEIELEEKIDSDLIGGMILRIGDQQLDASIRRKLNDIKQELVHA